VTRRLFLIAYACSGLAGLVYEVTWTRLLTLYIGHTTAAASAVVAAFLGGLAIGAAAGGRIASNLTPRKCLQAYVGLEVAVVVCALLLPVELQLLRPVLSGAYQDGNGAVFPLVRVLSCIVMVMIPALALGATFPMAVRWFARSSDRPAAESSTLYFVNTIGAAAGSMLAGFVLIPAIGMRATSYVAMAGTLLAAVCVLGVLRSSHGVGEPFDSGLTRDARKPIAQGGNARASVPPWIAIAVLGVSGFAALVHEIAWTRILSLILGPTTYAFAATLAAVIAGVAIGSGAGAWLVSRKGSNASSLLVFALSLAAVTAGWTYSIAGTRIPMMVARYVADFADFDQLLLRGVLLTMGLILPTSACLGAAFPLALALADDRTKPAAGRFGAVYAVNTLGSVTGSLAAGFLFIPVFGVQATLWIASGSLIACVLVLVLRGGLTRGSMIGGLATAAVAAVLVVTSPPWDRELLASGAYMYAPYVPKDLDLETQLKAGEMLFYEEGAAATVSVKKLTGTTTLAVDGKTDASNRGDMLTQKLIAHLPLLLHDNPKDVFIIGLGSGMTAGAALTHPIDRADVIEISPEVVKASAFFKTENLDALANPRTNLIVGDGRSHLSLSDRRYDVIVSEPSNPWIAGVSSLFTREFFASARERLKPGGIFCQWANAYNISEPDLKSILATFLTVFPRGTVWLVGDDDVLLVAAEEPIEGAMSKIAVNMRRPDAARDLASLGVVDAFSIESLFVAGPAPLLAYAGSAPIFVDDRITLEFTAPRELHNRNAGKNGAALRQLGHAPTGAGASQWRNRAAMMAKADHFQIAFDDYSRAVAAGDATAVDGFVKTALILKKAGEALGRLNGANKVAQSKLLAAEGRRDEARALFNDDDLSSASGLQQMAELFADAGDTVQLDATVTKLRSIAPALAATEYYAAVAAFLHGDAPAAVSAAQRAITIDPNYAPTYDLIGAAYTKLGQLDPARQAFQKSLSFDAHDSTAYENLGVLELNAGNRALAARYFAEALWLVPESQTARQGLAQARTP
jgi:spermidine synthase